jgi:hypothetical protein
MAIKELNFKKNCLDFWGGIFSDVLSLKNRIKFHRKCLGGGIGLLSGMMIAFANRVKRGQVNRVVNRVWKVFFNAD